MDSHSPQPVQGPHPLRIPLSNPWSYVLAASFLLAALFGVRLVNDSDLGFHLRTGQWIIQNHHFPSQDAFTYTVPGHEYLDMEWLYQVVIYLAWKLGSYSLLSVLHISLALLALLLLWGRLREGGTSPGITVLLFLLAVLSSEPRFRVRPEILTWVFLALDLWILDSRINRRRDLLFLLPLIQLLWVNTEGIFFLGPVVMAFYLFSGWFHSRKLDPKLLKVSAASVVLCLANPYFLRGALFPLDFLSTLGASDLFHQTVQEFQPPWSYAPPPWAPTPSYLWVYKVFCFFLLFLLAATAKQRKAHEWLLALFFFSLSAVAVRNIPLFMMACVPLAAASWRDLKWDRLPKLPNKFLSNPLVPWVLILFLLGFSARVVTNAHYVANRLTDRFGLGLDQEAQPVKASQFLLDNHLDGRIVNDLDDGDWLDWLVPQRTFIDGRLEAMGRDFRTQYVRSQAPGGLAGLLSQYQPDILFFNPLVVPQWAVDLRGMPDWRLVYLDSSNAVYLRKGYGGSIPAFDYGKLLDQNGISPSLSSQAPSLLKLEPPAWGEFWGDFFLPVVYPNNLLNLGIACNDTGNSQASEFFFLEAIRRTQGRFPDFYYDLGLLYAYTNRREEAVLCMERVLKERPRDPVARQILGLPPSP
jgi:hypothetical protein